MGLLKYPYAIKDWEKAHLYPKQNKLTKKLWAWEFLRRNPEYQKCWDNRNQNSVSPDKQFTIKSFCNPLEDKPHDLKFSGTWIRVEYKTPSSVTKSDFQKGEVVIVFNLNFPLNPQLDLAQRILKADQNIIGFKSHRPNEEKLIEYLRILDATSVKAKPKKIKEVLFPEEKYPSENFDPDSTYKTRKKEALEYRDSRYVIFPTIKASPIFPKIG
jgi:hypothetical protein